MKKRRPHNRHSTRLRGRDYSEAGAYFLTLCCYRDCAYFDDPGFKIIIETEWQNTVNLRPNVALDEFVVMPNHFHGIVVIKAYTPNVGAYCDTPRRQNNQPPSPSQIPPHNKSLFRSSSQTLGAIIRGFKVASTKEINIFRDSLGMHVWQRNFHDIIIRNAGEFAHYRQYIKDNPKNWEMDELNPHRCKWTLAGETDDWA